MADVGLADVADIGPDGRMADVNLVASTWSACRGARRWWRVAAPVQRSACCRSYATAPREPGS